MKITLIALKVIGKNCKYISISHYLQQLLTMPPFEFNTTTTSCLTLAISIPFIIIAACLFSKNFVVSMIFFSLAGFFWLCGCIVLTLSFFLFHRKKGQNSSKSAPEEIAVHADLESGIPSDFDSKWKKYDGVELRNGTEIVVQWPDEGGSMWPARVASRDTDDGYIIRWDSDGTTEDHVSPTRIVSYAPHAGFSGIGHEAVSTFAVGSQVEVNYKNQGNWLPCTINTNNGNDTHNVRYDVGEDEENVPIHRIRKVTIDDEDPTGLFTTVTGIDYTAQRSNSYVAVTAADINIPQEFSANNHDNSAATKANQINGMSSAPADTDNKDDCDDDIDFTQHPLYDKVYAQNGLTGQASYHFPYGIKDCYVSCENAPATWKLANGIRVPREKKFINVMFNKAERRFTGRIEWGSNTFQGAASLVYNFTFSPDYSYIADGTCDVVDARGSILISNNYGSEGADLDYHLVATFEVSVTDDLN